MLSNEELNQLRQEIDHTDIDLIQLLAKRLALSHEIGRHKLANQAPVRDLEREAILIQHKLELAHSLGLNPHFVHRIFDLIIEQSVKQQYRMKIQSKTKQQGVRVGYLGGRGSYSHQATVQHFFEQNSELRAVGYPTFHHIIQAVHSKEMDYGILPLENTTTGSLLEVYDLLQSAGIYIVGEEILAINHCLIGKRSANQSITKVFGHPQAIAQCNDLLQQHTEWQIEYCSSSAAAIEAVIKSEGIGCVAIANKFAADLYELDIILDKSSNQHKNFTRFIVISKQPADIPFDVPCKVSILFATRQDAGALVDVLTQFKNQKIVLTKLQSRPIPEKPWEEIFYLDFEGHLDDIKVKKAIERAERYCQFLKILGCYPNSKLEKPNLNVAESDKSN
jgi:chorismate mutase/prephenate dehydratase